MTAENKLIIFVKAPLPGKVKTRLVPPLTFQQAAELYKSWARGIYKMTTQLMPNVHLSVAYESDPKIPSIAWLSADGDNIPYFPQINGDLGERLIHAFSRAFGRFSKRVVIIGTDSPGLPSSYLMQAFERLESNDLVLGPTYDGGYYLVGLRDQVYEELFRGICWSTPKVFLETLLKARELKLSLHLLPKYFDIDTEQDLRRFWNQYPVLKMDERYSKIASLK